ncbi:MAG: 1-pyrroline-5-carboxylate dehydrogenase [Cryobacterium sp.]|nr:1-pyrroline-5-carboxylate dehydrogenase [Cryobacterium sp.]
MGGAAGEHLRRIHTERTRRLSAGSLSSINDPGHIIPPARSVQARWLHDCPPAADENTLTVIDRPPGTGRPSVEIMNNPGSSRSSAHNLQHDLGAEVVALVQKWLAESALIPTDVSAGRLAGVLRDRHGLDFTVGFVDGVMRPEDPMVAGYNLHRVAKKAPAFLPWHMRKAISLGGVLGPVLPWVVIPVARRVLREMVGHLVVDATPEKLGPAIAQLRQSGNRLNINLLGEAVLGEKEALRRLDGIRSLLARDDVDYVSIKVSSIASQLSMWSFDETVTRVVERLTPLYELAATSATTKFINLDMEEYRDLDLTIAVFERILDQPQLRRLEAGIVLQAYLPDALGALQGITAWAKRRRAHGGAPIKVRVVKGANLAMEHVDAVMHDWPLATYSSKQDTDTNYKRVLRWALTPENTDAVRIGVASHNLFDVAYAHLLATAQGVQQSVEFEMLLGMATGQAEAVKKDVGRLLLYTPVVDPAEFDVAIRYLIRRLERTPARRTSCRQRSNSPRQASSSSARRIASFGRWLPLTRAVPRIGTPPRRCPSPTGFRTAAGTASPTKS